jgi:transcriptional antiterminator
MINENEMSILQYLNNYNCDVEIAELSNFLKVGERSIRNYIKNINSTFNELDLIVKKGKVISDNRIILSNLINNSDSYYMTANSKKKLLLFHILFDEFINLSLLANDLEISRTSIKTYFDEIKEKYRPFGYQFISANRNGLQIIVNEEDLRIAQIQFLLEFESFNSYDQEIIKALIDNYLISVNLETINSFLVNLKNRNNFNITEQQYKMIYYLLAVQIKRNKTNNVIAKISKNENNFLPDINFYKKLMYSNSLPYNETEYIYLSNKLNQILYITNNSSSLSFEFSLLVIKIINLYSNYVGSNLINDKILYDSLIMHMKPTLFRLTNNIDPVDVNVNNIISKYQYEYNITKKVFQELNFFTNEVTDKKELAILTLYFRSALNRIKNIDNGIKNIIIVCNYGYGTSLLLKDQINDIYKVNIITKIANYELRHYNLDNVDAIITTITNFEVAKDIKIFTVSPVLTNENILTLNKFFTKKNNEVNLDTVINKLSLSCTINNEEQLKIDLLNLFSNIKEETNGNKKFLFTKNNILINQNIDSWQDAITIGGSLLLNNKSCSESYCNNLIKSFNDYGEYMIIDDQICIPHSKTDKEVLKADMSIVHLLKPVIYNGKPLRVFICFCSNNNDEHLNSLILISDLLQDYKIYEVFENMKDPKEVYSWLLEGFNKKSNND